LEKIKEQIISILLPLPPIIFNFVALEGLEIAIFSCFKKYTEFNMFKKIVGTFGIKVLIAILNLLIVVVLSNYFGATGKGEASLIIISISMVLLFSNLLGGPTLIYLVPRHNVFLLFLLSNLWSVFISASAFFVLRLFSAMDDQLIAKISILSLINAFLSTNLTILLGKERLRAYNLISLLQTILTLAFIFFIYSGDCISAVVVYSQALFGAMCICFIISTLCIIPYFRNWSLKNIKSLTIECLKIGFTNQTSQIIKFMSFRVSYYMLVEYAGASVLGVFSNGTSLIESLLLISNSFVSILYPKVSNSVNKKYSQLLTQQMTKMSIAFCLVALIPLLLIPSEFWVWLFGNEFNGVHKVIVLLSPGIIFYNISMVLNHYFSGLGHYRISTVAYFLGLIVVIGLSLIVIPKYGIIEAGIISSLSYMLTALFYMFYFSKEAKISVQQLLPMPSDITWFRKRVKTLFIKD
jgi:O-antigen/teichoic acid export membrane protein